MTPTRRSVLLSVGAVGAATALGGVLTGPAAAADGTWDSPRSANGWAMDPDAVGSFRVEGSPATVRLHRAAAPVLLHVARRWHYEVIPLRGSRHVLGHRTDRAVGAAYESNYLSGSAIALLGAGDGLWPHQEAVVRDILADCGGVVRWGTDLSPPTRATSRSTSVRTRRLSGGSRRSSTPAPCTTTARAPAQWRTRRHRNAAPGHAAWPRPRPGTDDAHAADRPPVSRGRGPAEPLRHRRPVRSGRRLRHQEVAVALRSDGRRVGGRRHLEQGGRPHVRGRLRTGGSSHPQRTRGQRRLHPRQQRRPR